MAVYARLTAVLATTLVTALAFNAAGAVAQPLVTGISGLGGDDDPLMMERVKDAGASFVQIQVSWGSVAPAEEPRGDWVPSNPSDPGYDWASVDSRVRSAVDFGLTPLILVDGGPKWAQRCTPPSYAAVPVCDPDPAALSAFATAVARRYSGEYGDLPRVRYWQGLNEPNLSVFFNPQFDGSGKPASAALYRKLINAFYDSVKEVKGSNLVLAAGLGPIAVPKLTIGPLRFTRELLCMSGRRNPRPTKESCEGGVHFDIFDIHPYTTGGPSHEGGADDVQLGDLTDLRELLTAADRAHRIKGRYRHTPLWITEFSWDTKPPDPGGLPMSIAARWAAEAMFRAWDAGISTFFWFSLRDSLPGKMSYSDTVQSGLYLHGETLADDKPKKLLTAFRFPFVAFRSKGEITYWGRTPTSEGGKVSIETAGQGGWRSVATARASGAGIFVGSVAAPGSKRISGPIRATFRRDRSLSFSLHETKDFDQPPFG